MWTYRAKVIRVIDGDTVDVDIDLGFGIWQKNERVRIMGIDTPESRTRDKEEKVRGLLAKKYLSESLKKGKKLVLKTYKDYETGKFGRILGDVWIDGKSINAQMIKDFMAVPYNGQSKEMVEKLHEANNLILQRLGKISG